MLADAQTAGRGPRGHTWFSPVANGLYVSVVLTPSRTRGSRERALSLLTIAAGVALSEAVQHSTGLTAHIKWPNDLLIGRRKLAAFSQRPSMDVPIREMSSPVSRLTWDGCRTRASTKPGRRH